MIGSIPFGLIFGKLLGSQDLRTIGSGNIGTTNAFRTGKKIIGILTFIFDTLKGLISYLLAISFGYEPSSAFIIGMFSILGHIFPIWLKFKGGKGVATTIGVLLLPYPLITFLGIIIWGTILKIFKFSSLAGVIMISFYCIALIFVALREEYIAFLIIFTLIIYRHKDNILRIKDKTEIPFI